MQKIREIIVPSAFSAAASVLIYKYALGEDLTDDIPFLSYSMQAWQVVGVSSLIGSVAGEFAADVAIPKSPKIEMLAGIQDIIVPPAITGLTTYGTLKVLVSGDTSFKNGFLLGAGSSLVGKGVYNQFYPA